MGRRGSAQSVLLRDRRFASRSGSAQIVQKLSRNLSTGVDGMTCELALAEGTPTGVCRPTGDAPLPVRRVRRTGRADDGTRSRQARNRWGPASRRDVPSAVSDGSVTNNHPGVAASSRYRPRPGCAPNDCRAVRDHAASARTTHRTLGTHSAFVARTLASGRLDRCRRSARWPAAIHLADG